MPVNLCSLLACLNLIFPVAYSKANPLIQTGPSDYPNIRLVCKQLLLELPFPDAETLFFSRNAFQFADLKTADAFLFGLSEPQRSSITHLKLAIPENIGSHEHYGLWLGILNYFSNPWERKSVSFDRLPREIVRILNKLYLCPYPASHVSETPRPTNRAQTTHIFLLLQLLLRRKS